MFSKNLVVLRKNKGISQEQLAQELLVSKQSIYKWENNRSVPDMDNIMAISKFFEVSVEDLFEGEFVFVKGLKNNYYESAFKMNKLLNQSFFKRNEIRFLFMLFVAFGFFMESIFLLNDTRE